MDSTSSKEGMNVQLNSSDKVMNGFMRQPTLIKFEEPLFVDVVGRREEDRRVIRTRVR